MKTTHVTAHNRAAKAAEYLLKHDEKASVTIKGKKYMIEHKKGNKNSHTATVTEVEPATIFTPETKKVIAEVTIEN